MKKILILNGHPNKESLCHELATAYYNGAITSNAETKILHVADLSFNPNLAFGYRKRTESEPDIEEARKLISWATHIVVVFPVWWGTFPALLKGFIDRTLLPGYAFKYHEKSVWWDKLLAGKTGHIIYTIDQPLWYFRFINHRPAVHAMKKMTLQFCGIKKVKVTGFGSVRYANATKIEKWLKKTKTMGLNNA